MKKNLIPIVLIILALILIIVHQTRTELFWQQGQIETISHDEITLRGGSPIRFDETTQAVFFDSNARGWSGSNLWDSAQTIRGAHRVVNQWLDRVLAEELVEVGTVADIEINPRSTERQTIMGEVRDGEFFATTVIVRLPQPPMDITQINFLGAPASRGEEDYWSFMYFQNTSFNSKDLNDAILLDWIATNEHIFPEFESARLNLTNGHELRLSRENIRYFLENELRYLGYQIEDEFRWMNAQTGEGIPSPILD